MFKQSKYHYNSISDDSWFNYFGKMFDVDLNADDVTSEILYVVSVVDTSILNADITFTEVRNAVDNIKRGKACGIDGISAEIVKNFPRPFLDCIHVLFQKCLETGVYPTQWKTAIINPVLKKGNHNTPSNYRPITLLSILNKMFTLILANRLRDWLEEFDILSPAQAGFRKNFSTQDNCFVLSTAIHKALSVKGGKLYAVFIDFKSAFDNVNRKLLFNKLNALGIDGRFLNIVIAMYSNLKAVVKCNNGLTPEFQCTNGVRQGCNLSPLLFNLFINDVVQCLNDSKIGGIDVDGLNLRCLLYADDLTIFSNSGVYLTKLLKIFDLYCERNKLTVNHDKCKVIVFRKGGYLAHNDKWYINRRSLEVVNFYNYLGLGFTPKASWSAAQSNLSASALRAVFSLKKMFADTLDLPVRHYLQIFDTKVLPILTYMSEIWGTSPHKSTTSVYNNFHKYVLGLPYNAVNTISLGELGRVTFDCHSINKVILFWLRILKHNNNRYTRRCLNDQVILAERGVSSWGLELRNILFRFGFGEVWLNQGVGDEALFLNCFKQRVIDVNMQNLKSNLVAMDRLRTYNIIKQDFFVENYILYLKHYHHRKVLALFRCNALNIEVNQGRKANIPYSERLCSFCNLHAIGDEFHLLLVCPFFTDLRTKYIPCYYWRNPSYLLFSSLLNTDSTQLLSRIALFIISSMKRRAEGV